MKTFSPKKSDIVRDWHVIDAAGMGVGRLATEVARLLTGKHKPSWAPHVDTGDFVIVVNAEQTVFSGRKDRQKIYYRVSMHPGGIKAETARHLRRRLPARIIERAVWGMLPKTRLGRRQLRKLKVYAGSEHPHQAQQPTPLALKSSA